MLRPAHALRLLPLAIALTLTACGDEEFVFPTPTPTSVATATPPPASPTAVAPTTTVSPPATTAPTPAVSPTVPPGSAAAVAAARTALARWLGPVGDPAAITTKLVEAVMWRDGCLELARPGRLCTQAFVDGFRIQLGLASATYEVRTDRTGSNVRWAPSRTLLVKFASVSTPIILLTTDDGRTLDVQLVFGTDSSVPLSSLRPGDPVSIGVVEAPQSGGLLLVWLDRAP